MEDTKTVKNYPVDVAQVVAPVIPCIQKSLDL